MSRPQFLDDEAFRCLREGDIKGFHEQIKDLDVVDFSGANLRTADLRKADLSKVILREAYLRDADLRGQDLRNTDLEGCSIRNAHISGTYFPENITAEEIRLSVEHGTRIRVRK